MTLASGPGVGTIDRATGCQDARHDERAESGATDDRDGPGDDLLTVTISTFVPDREITWTILGQIRPQIGHVYGYTLEPADTATLVTSYYDWRGGTA